VLQKYFYGRATQERYRASPAGEYFDGFAAHLVDKNVPATTGCAYFRAAYHLGNWMKHEGLSMADLNESIIARFERHLPECRCTPPSGRARKDNLSGARRFLEYLRANDIARSPALSRFVEGPYAISRYRDGAVASHLDGFAEYLHDKKYARETGLMHLGATLHLGHWMECEGLTVKELNEKSLEAFERHIPNCQCPPSPRGRWYAAPRGARIFLRYLREKGIVDGRDPKAVLPIVVEFCEWMKVHRGVGESTLEYHRGYLRRFLRSIDQDSDLISASTIRQFLLTTEKSRNYIHTLRMFIRFLVTTGRCKRDLEKAVPSMAQWRLSSLPRYLPSDEVEKVISTAPMGSRDRGVLLLLARLGLRRSDVVDLTLSDLDWEKALVRVVGKSGREAYLPLPQDAGDAILAYVENQRPESTSDKVFLRSMSPPEPLTPNIVSGIVYWAIHRAGIPSPSRGCHLLRHSAATRWLRDGLSMEEIGVLLRHRHLETTEIYAKVDVNSLREIAQPWPGAR
jgi:site-specific recombinase XerD